MTTRLERVVAANAALEAWREAYGVTKPDEADLADLLADLMHRAAREKIDFEAELERARMNFNAEKQARWNQHDGSF